MKVAVVILNYNGEKLLPQFLPSVVAHSPGARIIVADNGSTDQSLSFIQRFPEVELLQLDKNYGYCGGYNRALQQIDAPYYVLLNSDVEVTTEWLTPMLSLLENNDAIAAVQPKILSWHKKSHFEYAGAGGGFIDAMGYPFCRGRLFDNVEKDEGQYNDVREVFWASGACLMIRSSVYHAMGGLDEDFFAHMEEIDLCWRIQRAGKKVFYCGKSTVYHVGAGTLNKSNPRKTYLNFRNGLSLLYKNLSPNALLPKLVLRVLLDWVAAVKFFIQGETAHASAVFNAHRHFIQQLSRDKRKRIALKGKFPFTTDNIYGGLILWDHFILRRKKISI